MRKTLVKGSKAAKDFMAKLRAKKGAVKKTIKRVAKNAKQSFKDGYYAKDKVGETYKSKKYKGYLIDKNYNGMYKVYLPNYVRFQQADTLDAIKRYINNDIKLEKERNKLGSTLLINKGENPRKKPTRVIQVDRTKKGAFKKFKTISGVSKKHTDTKSHNISIKVGALPSYKDPDAAREIQLYADNDSQLYYQRRKPILINLSKKHKKGQYDIDKAAKLWRYYIDAAMQKYQKEFGGRGSWSNLLSVADRKVLANDYALNTLEEFELGNYTEK